MFTLKDLDQIATNCKELNKIFQKRIDATANCPRTSPEKKEALIAGWNLQIARNMKIEAMAVLTAEIEIEKMQKKNLQCLK